MSHFTFKDIATNSDAQRFIFLLNTSVGSHGSLEKLNYKHYKAPHSSALKRHTNCPPCYFQRENILPHENTQAVGEHILREPNHSGGNIL